MAPLVGVEAVPGRGAIGGELLRGRCDEYLAGRVAALAASRGADLVPPLGSSLRLAGPRPIITVQPYTLTSPRPPWPPRLAHAPPERTLAWRAVPPGGNPRPTVRFQSLT